MKIAGIIIAVAVAFYFGGCSYNNVDDIKAHAEQTWHSAGFKVVGYEGYQIGIPFVMPGGRVWYIVEKEKDSRVRYNGYLSRWSGEYHINSLKAIDAIAGN